MLESNHTQGSADSERVKGMRQYGLILNWLMRCQPVIEIVHKLYVSLVAAVVNQSVPGVKEYRIEFK